MVNIICYLLVLALLYVNNSNVYLNFNIIMLMLNIKCFNFDLYFNFYKKNINAIMFQVKT